MTTRSTESKKAGQFASDQQPKPRAPTRKQTVWDREAKSILRAEMQRRNFSFKELALALERAGHEETERRLISRISRGTFSFAFALRCFRAMGVEKIFIGSIS